MRGWVRGAVLTGAVMLSGCGQEPQQTATDVKAPPRYVYAIKADIGGSYVPDREIQRLNWRLKSVDLGEAADFAKWQDGPRNAANAPVVFVFEDTDKRPEALNAAGKPRTLSVVAAAYAIEGEVISLTAISGGLGEIVFTGSHDGDALKGNLKVGPETFENITLK